MKLKILSVGKIKEKWLRAGIDEYSKRLSRFVILDMPEVPDSPDNLSAQVSMKQEGERILAKLQPQDFVVLVDLHGREMDSVEFSKQIRTWQELSGDRVVFVIAGSQGYDPSVRERAQASVCLSQLTFPHQMVRLILLEQLYRGFKILNGEKYHK